MDCKYMKIAYFCMWSFVKHTLKQVVSQVLWGEVMAPQAGLEPAT